MHIWESSNVGPYPPRVLLSLPQRFLFLIILVQIETNSIARCDQDKTNDHHVERPHTFYVIGLVRSSLKDHEDNFVHDLNVPYIMKLHACLFSIPHESAHILRDAFDNVITSRSFKGCNPPPIYKTYDSNQSYQVSHQNVRFVIMMGFPTNSLINQLQKIEFVFGRVYILFC